MKTLLSAHITGKGDVTNKRNTVSLRQWLVNKRYTFEPCVGVYKGKAETSFLVKCHGPAMDELHSKAWAMRQECILTMNDNGENATLVYPDSIPNSLGKFHQVFRHVATAQDSYTILHGRYYIAS